MERGLHFCTKLGNLKLSDTQITNSPLVKICSLSIHLLDMELDDCLIGSRILYGQ